MNSPSVHPTLLTNARLVLADEVVHGSLLCQNGTIASVDLGPSALHGAIDLEGDYLLPGMVEVHTDNFERHLMPRPKVRWDDAPALLAHDAEIAAAGITTVLDALGVGESDPDSVRGSEWNSVLQCLAEFSGRGVLRAEHLLHVRCELPAPNTLDLFTPFIGNPMVRMISLMDHTPGQRQWENIEHAWIYFTGKKGWSQAKFEERVALSKEHQARYAQPHRSYFTAYCKQHGIARPAMTTPPSRMWNRHLRRAQRCANFRPPLPLRKPRVSALWPPSWAGPMWCAAAHTRAMCQPLNLRAWVWWT